MQTGMPAASLTLTDQHVLATVLSLAVELGYLTQLRAERSVNFPSRGKNVRGKNVRGKNVRGKNVRGKNVRGKNVRRGEKISAKKKKVPPQKRKIFRRKGKIFPQKTRSILLIIIIKHLTIQKNTRAEARREKKRKKRGWEKETLPSSFDPDEPLPWQVEG